MIRRVGRSGVQRAGMVDKDGYRWICRLPAGVGRLGIEQGRIYLDLSPGVDERRIVYTKNDVDMTVTIEYRHERPAPAPIINLPHRTEGAMAAFFEKVNYDNSND